MSLAVFSAMEKVWSVIAGCSLTSVILIVISALVERAGEPLSVTLILRVTDWCCS